MSALIAWTYHLSVDGYPTTSSTDKRSALFSCHDGLEIPIMPDELLLPKTISEKKAIQNM